MKGYSIMESKEVLQYCKDCKSYKQPKCKLTDEFTARKKKCDSFRRK